MKITVEKIIQIVCEEFMVSKESILIPRRCKRHIEPRQCAHWLAYKMSGNTLPTIGNAFNRDHTTIYHSSKMVDQEVEKKTEAGRRAIKLLRKLQGIELDNTTPWIQTATGKAFYPLDPRSTEIDIVDIAHALSHLCRYAGHTKQFYSVAQHSVLVARALPDHLKLWGLLHDASEAYLVDIPAPIKPMIGGYADIERNVMRVICEKFGLQQKIPAEVKRVDVAILADERNQLMTKPPMDWKLKEPPLGIQIDYWPPEKARAEFMSEFRRLSEYQRAAA